MKKAISFFTRICEAWLPDAFVFSLILTLLVYFASLFLTSHSPLALVEFWSRDFWTLNGFAMQMVFVLLTGHLLATTPVVQRILSAICGVVRTEKSALIVIAVFSVLANFINWGFGLIVSGILAVELARKLGKVNVGLFIATAYAGFVVWHGGLSGSVPLKIAGSDEVLQKIFPELSIPLSETIFTPANILMIVLILVSLPILSLLMRTDQKSELRAKVPEKNVTEKRESNFRIRMESSVLLVLIFFAMAMLTIFHGGSFDINRVNFIFLFLALLFHRTPANFLSALQGSIGVTSGIIIQFPFYAGIMGLMQYSGLADILSHFFVSISTPLTLPIFTFLSAGMVNFFIPSGGGQWVVQGPIMLTAARDLGVNPAKIAMALAWGDAWTNLIQPFWALPLLGLAGLSLKDIMGYCLIYVLFTGMIISGVLLVF